jgi:hypothetical protein
VKKILFREGQYATFIEVYIHDWMEIANGPPPSPQDGQGMNRYARQGGGQNRNQKVLQHQARRSSGSSNATPSDISFPSILQRRAGRRDREFHQNKMVWIPKQARKVLLISEMFEDEKKAMETREVMIGSIKVVVPLSSPFKEVSNKSINRREKAMHIPINPTTKMIVSMKNNEITAS